MRRQSVAPGAAPIKVGLVCTLVNAEQVLHSFLRYHLGLGFDRIFLFFDRATDPALAIAQEYAQVTAWVRDGDLEQRWQACRLYQQEAQVRDYVQQEVMARQQLNVELAIAACKEQGVDWLVHIDVDELFYLPDESLQAHFSRLTRMGLDNLIYPNWEGVPEQMEIGDYFQEVTLFKRKPLKYSRAQRHFLARQPKVVGHRLYHFYENGKSAGRIGPDLLPHGVHGFATYRYSQRASLRLLEKGGWFKLREIKREVLEYLGIQLPRRRKALGNAAILHYPCCGFQQFWDKYVTLGDFPDTWFGKTRIAKTISMQVEARDVVNKAGRAAAQAFYHQRFVYGDAAEVQEWMDQRLMVRITQPAHQLAASTLTISPPQTACMHESTVQ